MQSTMEIDKKSLLYNINKIKKFTNKKIMAIVKANGYGTYINKDLSILNNFDILGVAYASEGKEIRKLGYKKEIFILNQPNTEDIEDIIKYNLSFGLSSMEFLKYIIKTNYKFNVHLEIETGMNRTGIKLDNLIDFIELIKSTNNIKVSGVYTHLSSPDIDKEYTLKQLDLFHKSLNIVKENFSTIKYIHSCASNGMLNFDDNKSNLIRLGILLYGYESYKGAFNKIKLKPICKLKTKINFIKEINSNESIGYSRSYISKKKMKIATISIGYADGLRREFSNDGYVVVNKQKAKIVGNICMDSCMIDITNIDNVNINEYVYIWDNDIQTVDDIAKIYNTINYEVISSISDRVKRVIN